MTDIVSENALKEAYDASPYESYPFAQTHPQHLRAVARLFGLEAPDPARSRILELGCAMGGNIIPLALRFPDAQVVGVDLSPRQIERARADAAHFDVPNLRLEAMSIADVDESFGVFDYIICHGVFSWVPPEIQRRIFEISKRQLSPRGVAYISYNTLPGWNMVRSLREMMLYHTAPFETPERKAQEARGLLHFLKDATSGRTGDLHAELIDRELASLDHKGNYYLLHDHLEDFNHQFYFHQFAEMAQGHGLQYLGDTAVSSMFAGNLKPDVAEKLIATNDIVRSEQYMDFINNRRFRSTLLCHDHVTLRRNLEAADVDRFFIRAQIRPKTPVDLSVETTVEFAGPVNFSTHTRTANAVFAALAEARGQPVFAEDLYKATSRKLKNVGPDQVRAVFHESALRLFLAGGLQLCTEAGDYTTRVSARPKACPLARFQAATGSWVTNGRHEPIGLDPFQKTLLPHLTGENDTAALRALFLAHIEKGDIKVSLEGNAVKDQTILVQEVDKGIEQTLAHFAESGLLLD